MNEPAPNVHKLTSVHQYRVIIATLAGLLVTGQLLLNLSLLLNR